MDLLILCLVVLARRCGGHPGRAAAARARRQRELGDARAEAQRWYERLGGQVMNLHGDDPAVRQALADAGERYNAAGSQLRAGRTPPPVRAGPGDRARGAGVHPGRPHRAWASTPAPSCRRWPAARGAGQLTKEREVDVQGQRYKAGPQPGADTPYYYPGGRVQGRPVPAGWYSQPWWKTALGRRRGRDRRPADLRRAVLAGLRRPGLRFDQGYQEGFQDGGGDAGGDMAATGRRRLRRRRLRRRRLRRRRLLAARYGWLGGLADGAGRTRRAQWQRDHVPGQTSATSTVPPSGGSPPAASPCSPAPS